MSEEWCKSVGCASTKKEVHLFAQSNCFKNLKLQRNLLFVLQDCVKRNAKQASATSREKYAKH